MKLLFDVAAAGSRVFSAIGSASVAARAVIGGHARAAALAVALAPFSTVMAGASLLPPTYTPAPPYDADPCVAAANANTTACPGNGALDLPAWIQEYCRCRRGLPVIAPPSNPSQSMDYRSGCFPTASELAYAVCAFFNRCGPAPAQMDCQAIFAAVEFGIGRPLTPEEAVAIQICLGCTNNKCANGNLTVGCPPANQSPCDSLKQALNDAIVCHLKAINPLAPPTSKELLAEISKKLGKAACDFRKKLEEEECPAESGGTIPPMSCQDVIACLQNSEFSGYLNKDFFCEFFKCTSGCTPAVGLDQNGQFSAPCDVNGDSTVDCDDLRLQIEMFKGLRCKVGGQDPSDEELADLVCRFYGNGTTGQPGCFKNPNEANDPRPAAPDCLTVANCLMSIEGLSEAVRCKVLGGKCSPPSPVQCPGLGEAFDTDQELCNLARQLLGMPAPQGQTLPPWQSSGPVVGLCSLLDSQNLGAILAILRCRVPNDACPDLNISSDFALEQMLRNILTNCPNFPCDRIAGALWQLLPYGRAKAIYDRIQPDFSQRCNDSFDEAVDNSGVRPQPKCGTSGMNPVDFATGEKFESSTDLVVALPGRSWSLDRHYSSDPTTLSRPSVLGRGWNIGTFSFLKEATLNDVYQLQIHQESPNTFRAFFPISPGATQFHADRDTLETVAKLTGQTISLRVGTATGDIYRLDEPGVGSTDYFAGSSGASSTSLLGKLVGKKVRETSIHGQVTEYIYDLFGSNIRPVEVRLFAGAATGTPAARVVFDWYGAAFALASNDATRGRLAEVRVLRTVGGSERVTQYVRYTYFGQQGITVAQDVGTAGDLIQVVEGEAVDTSVAEPVFRELITQYRYHRSERVLPSNVTGNSSTTSVVGVDHQIKMVIKPEQIEWFGRQLSRSIPSITPDVAQTVAASDLLARSDNAPFVELSDNLPGTSVPAAAPKLRRTFDLASKIVGYLPVTGSTGGQVSVQFLMASCGCTSGGQGIVETYEYVGGASGISRSYFGGSAPGKAAIVREYTVDAAGAFDATAQPYRTSRHELVLISGIWHLYCKAVSVDADNPSSLRWWIWGYRHDNAGRETHAFMPSSIASLTIGTDNLATFAVKTDSTGLVNVTVYPAYDSGANPRIDSRPIERRVGSGFSTSNSSYTLVESMTYAGVLGDPKQHLLASRTAHRWEGTTASTVAGDLEVTTYSYGFRGTGERDLAWTKTSRELEANSGFTEGETSDTFTLIDQLGQTVARRAADGAVQRYTYDGTTGAIIESTANANSVADLAGLGSPTGWNLSAAGVGPQMKTVYVVDAIGRTVAIRRPPGGVSNSVTIRTVRQLRIFSDLPGGRFYTEIALPHKLSGSNTYSGPATVSVYNAGGRAISTREYLVEFDPSNPAGLTLGQEVSRSVMQLALTGTVMRTAVWSSMGNTGSGTGVPPESADVSMVSYDSRGRVETRTSPVESLTRYTYDNLDRVIKTESGVSGDLKPISEFFYDSPASSVAQGVGDGNVTVVRQHVRTDTSPAVYRDYRRRYDQRNRLVQVLGPSQNGGTPIPPHEIRGYDNLDRPVERALVSAVPAVTDTVQTLASSRLLYTQSAYSQRGLGLQSRVAISPTVSLPSDIKDRSAATFDALVTSNWFDLVGRTVATAAPSSAFSKKNFDRLGRLVDTFVTDRGGASVSTSETDGDRVLEQTRYEYDARDRIVLVRQLKRLHSDNATRGPLLQSDGLLKGSPIQTFAGTVYDDADRVIQSIDHGTNEVTSGEMRSNNQAPTVAFVSSPSTSEHLVSQITYNPRGLVQARIDPAGRRTHFKYDAQDRQIAVVENASTGFDVDSKIVWSGSSNQWQVSDLSASQPDANRVTRYDFDGAGRVVRLVAYNPTSANSQQSQVTEYVYGTSTNPPSGELASGITSKDLLAEVRYPNRTDGSAGTSSANSYKVRYAYNIRGELTSTIDQNGTRHDYVRDGAGRVILDSASVLGTNIDGQIRSIGVSYDSAGRLQEAVSYTDTAGGSSAVNTGVYFEYGPLWQLTKLHQTDGKRYGQASASESWLRTVEYNYLTSAASNQMRLSSTKYPSGLTTVATAYSSIGGIDDRIARAASISAALVPGVDGPVVSYQRLGLGTVAVVDYETADVQLDRTFSSDGTGGSLPRARRSSGWTNRAEGQYPGFDRFGRLQRHAWVDGLTGNGNVPGSSSSSPSSHRPAILEEVFSYDKAGNRTGKRDGREKAKAVDRDWSYSYDSLNRLTQATRGATSGTAFTQSVGGQQWVLDALGNWISDRKDLAPSTGSNPPSFSNAGDSLDERSYNQANELTQRVLKTGDGSTVLATLPFAYDDAGNLREQATAAGQGVRFTHDAWGRLVRTERKKTQGQTISYAFESSNRYNAMHWRVESTKTVADVFNQKTPRSTYFTYDASWRILEELQIDTVSESPTETTVVLFSNVWGLRYIDDAAARIRTDLPKNTARTSVGTTTLSPEATTSFHLITDAQFSVVASMGPGLSVPVDRIEYSPYGVAFANPGGDADGSGEVDINDYTLVAAFASDITSNMYAAEYDFNRDGLIDEADADFVLNAQLGAGSGVMPGQLGDSRALSGGPRLNIGYCGYIFNDDSYLYTVRFRHYSPGLGRWLERDPAGYIDGVALHEYASGSPIAETDPLGLLSDDPQWHHEFPQSPFKNAKCKVTFDIHKAEFGRIYYKEDHWNTTHGLWNKSWEDWLEGLHKQGKSATEEAAREYLNELKNDPRFREWLSKGAPTKTCYATWQGLSTSQKRLEAEAAHKAMEATKKSILKKVAAKAAKTGKIVKGLSKATVILPVGYLAIDYLTTKKALAVCVADNVLPVETEDIQEGIENGQVIYGDFVDRGSKNINRKHLKGTAILGLPMDKPFPGECGCRK